MLAATAWADSLGTHDPTAFTRADLGADRIMMYKRFQNVDIVDWDCVSTKSDCENPDFKRILETMIPKSATPDQKDLDSFFGK